MDSQHFAEHGGRPKAPTHRSARRGSDEHVGIRGDFVRLQRSAGNSAVAAMLRSQSGQSTVIVQRHSSHEHTLLGNTPPKQLGSAAIKNSAKIHVVYMEWQRVRFFKTAPGGDPRSTFPEVRWIQLKGSGLWLSYGELNALSDYLPDPSTVDILDRATLLPVLQKVRNVIYDHLAPTIGLNPTVFRGAASSAMPGAGGEVLALDTATASLGTNRYKGLVARNACHFAPFSWQRWSLFHNEAREEAAAHHREQGTTAPVKDVTVDTDEHQRQAWLKAGYGDHFLQDSFAAGHLVNKTLVMQWFVDYLNSLSSWARPWFGLPDAEVLATMGSKQQTNMAGQSLYGRAPSANDVSSGDRLFGNTVADPQTAQERGSREHRVAGSGVTTGAGRSKEQNYQAYLRFLNSGFLQLAAGAAHDYLNQRGLTVRNGAGDEFRVGGDDTLMSKSDQAGAEIAGRAAHLSQTAIADLLRTGTTAVTVDEIWSLVPQTILWEDSPGGTKAHSLADFQDSVLHQLCLEKLFPKVISTLSTNTAVRALAADMVKGGISDDVNTSPATPGPVGDLMIEEPAGPGSRRV